MHNDHHHEHEAAGESAEYAKLALIITLITVASVILTARHDWSWLYFIDYFMGVFFVVFAFFKLLNLRMFIAGFASYDIIARKFTAYAAIYPFLQAFLGLVYLSGNVSLWSDLTVLAVSLVSSIGVLREMGSKIKCACLGNFVRLPLTKISFIEDFGMAVMAAAMIMLR